MLFLLYVLIGLVVAFVIGLGLASLGISPEIVFPVMGAIWAIWLFHKGGVKRA